jgi:ZIP family zinc transporter
MSKTNQDALVAFSITALAGAATALGASVVFFPSLVKVASRRVLAGALGFSAGVMTYVSFVEIFQKSVVAFEGAEFAENMAYIYATASFFGGVLVMKMVDVCVHLLSGGHHHHHHDHTVGDINYESCEACGQRIISPHNVGQSDDPVAELNEWHQRADRELEEHNHGTVESQDNMNDNSSGDGTNEEEGEEILKSDDEFNDDGERQQQQNKQRTSRQRDEENIEAGCIQQRIVENPPAHGKDPNEDHKLITMGISTALAIAIHNFPEGLATFVAALHDPSVGAVLAIAIGIHNIPEG